MADRYEDLLVADVARSCGVADAAQVAAAMRKSLEHPAGQRPALIEVLAAIAGWDAETAETVRDETARRVAEAGGDARRALIRRGGPAASLPPASEGQAPGGQGTELREAAAGRYRDFEPVGRGGMGVVYWAVDHELHREVAFKVLQPADAPGAGVTPPAPDALEGPTDDVAVEALRMRFLQEAWVTGGMAHPGIPPVFELGKTRAGLPYYTMRFVPGSRTLATALAEMEGHDVERRLELLEPYLKVLDAVAYAHSRGVIHRDLKPANVALGEYGEVIVIDWGLARVLGSEQADTSWASGLRELRDEGDLRTSAKAIGTPGYIAPESLADSDVRWSERSDVFSLGVILYETLTGRLPFVSSSLEAYARDVGSQATPDPRDVAQEVPDALATLCTRMLAPAPTARPGTVGEIAQEIRALQARRRAAREADRLLVRAEADLDAAGDLAGDALFQRLDRATAACRHARELAPANERSRVLLDRAALLRARGLAERDRAARRQILRRAGLVTLVTLVVVGAITTWMIEGRRREAEDARADADEARARAEGLMSFVVGDLKEKLEPLGRLDLLAAIGDRSGEYYENLPLELSSEASLRNRATGLRTLGDVHFLRGDLSRAIAAYEQAAAAAQRLEEVFGDTEAALLRSLAEASRARSLLEQGYGSDALRLLEAHASFVRGLLQADPENEDYALALAQAYEHLSVGRLRAGRMVEALASATEGLAQAVRLHERGDERGAWREHEIEAHLLAATILAADRRWDIAGDRAQIALDLAEREVAARPEEARWRVQEAAAHVGIGRAASEWGDARSQTAWTLALDRYERALGIYEALRRRDPGNLRLAQAVASVETLLGDALGFLQRREEAERCYRGAYEVLDALVGHDESNARWKHGLVTLCDRLNRSLLERDERLRIRSRAAELSDELHRRDPGNDTYVHLQVYTTTRLGTEIGGVDKERSRALLEEAIRLGVDLLERDPRNPNLVTILNQGSTALAELLFEAGEEDEAVSLLESMIERTAKARRLLPNESQLPAEQAASLGRLAGLHLRRSPPEMDAACDALRAAVEVYDEMLADPTCPPAARTEMEAKREALDREIEKLER